MVTPTAGAVVLVPFPFSDLTRSKLRPAICLADAGRDDWILCQLTSKPYGDSRAVLLHDPDFVSGGLRVSSFARPGKLFTASRTLMVAAAGQLSDPALRRVVDAVLAVLRPGSAP